MNPFKAIFAASVLAVMGSAASAVTVNFDYGSGSSSSNNLDLGTSATLAFSAENTACLVGDLSCVKVTVSATNTSDASTGGYLTAFGFDTFGGTYVAGSYDNGGYSAMQVFTGTTLAEFGGIMLDVGAGTGGQYEGGGAPSGGITIGSTGTFMFLLDATYDAATFLSNISSDYNDGTLEAAVRFRGLNGQPGSDKLTPDTPDTPEVPLPAAGWLLIAGVGGLAALKRRKS